MNTNHALCLGALLFLPSGCTSPSDETVAPGESPPREEIEEGGESAVRGLGWATSLSFEDVAPGSLPEGWKVEGTAQEGPLASWKVVEDASAPSVGHVLALASVNHESSGTYNLCWSDRSRFRDGAIEVAFKSVAGEEDQGGGLIWRALDQDNYYVCRANPLESNFRVYVVQAGKRRQLASVKLELESGTWHTLRIEHEGERIECSLDGKALLEATDATFPDAGGVGLWTKADAVTSFDDLKIMGVER